MYRQNAHNMSDMIMNDQHKSCQGTPPKNKKVLSALQ